MVLGWVVGGGGFGVLIQWFAGFIFFFAYGLVDFGSVLHLVFLFFVFVFVLCVCVCKVEFIQPCVDFIP